MAEFSSDSNAQAVATALHQAADNLADLEDVNAEAGRVVLAAAHPPRRSGELASKLRAWATGRDVVMASTARHFTFVHWGAPRIHVRAQPFVLTALRATADEVADLYGTHIQTTLRKVP